MAHKPPSRQRYEKKNPSISIRLTADLRALIDEARGEMSYPAYVKNVLNKSIDELNKSALQRARESGFKKAESSFKITLPCSECGKPMVITSGGPIHNDMKEHYNNWVHGDC